MSAYKKDQGRMVRMAAFWSVAVLIFYGCVSLRSALSGWFPGSLGVPVVESLPRIPVLGIDLTGATLVAVAVCATGIFLIYRWIEKPRNADLLIDTESELKKVTWPTPQEVFNSSLVVVVFVLILMAFLAGADYFLARLVNPVLF